MSAHIWNYRPQASPGPGVDLIGFRVEATDGHLGKVAEATHEVGSAYIVVDTGPWILGSLVLLPAGTITQVDEQEQVVRLDRSKDDIRTAPPYDPTTTPGDVAYIEQIQNYYQQPS